jgi:hypothetical protein
MYRKFIKRISRETYLAILLSILVFIIYLFSGRDRGIHYNYFIYLADSFLHGRLDILFHPPWLNELVFWQGHYFTVYPPMPAILLMPFVAVFGINFPQPLLSVIVGSINVFLCYLVISKLFNKNIGLWTSFLYAFGSMQWFHASVGSAWYIAHIIAMFFVWLALLEIATKKRLFIIGLLIGFAYLARLPAILAFVFVIIYFHDQFFCLEKKKLNIHFKNCFFFALGFLPALIFNVLYNYFRFRVPYDIGYILLPISNESWYRYGLFNIRYIPIHLTEILTALPKFINKPPFVIPSIFVMALWFVTPVLLIIIKAKYRTKLIFASLITILTMSIPGLMHGGNEFTQFGYRNALD